MARSFHDGDYGFVLCEEWSKHSFAAAVSCQDEARAWILAECKRDDLPEHKVRDCLLHDFGPWSDDDPDGY